MAIELKSSAFANGDAIPQVHTCDGDDTSPPLSWTGVPADARSLALIMEDPDAPSGLFTHWVLFGFATGTSSLAEGGPLPAGAKEGPNDFRRSGYGGPCPPPGEPHRYFFRLYALNEAPELDAGATRADLLQWMEGHILEQGELMGMYGR